MVLDREVKEDVFTPFQIDTEVKNNEKRLHEQEQQGIKEIANSRFAPKEDVFEQFGLSDIVKENELRLREAAKKREASSDEEQNALQNTSKHKAFKRASSFMKRPSIISFESQSNSQNPNNWSNMNGGGKKRPSRISKILSVRSLGTSGHNSSLSEIDDDHKGNPSDEVSDNKTGKEGNVPDVKIDSKDATGTVEATTIDTSPLADGDRYGYISNVFESPTPFKHESDEEIIRPTDISGSHLYWKSASDDIFKDFDLSAIVKDYEKLQRKKNFAPEKARDDDEEGLDNEYPRKSRYQNLKEWWLDNFPRCHGVIFRVFIPCCIILSIAIFLGYFLASFEHQEEYQRNDAVMQHRFLVEQFPFDESLQFLFGLPTVCFDYYVLAKDGISDNGTGTADPYTVGNITEWIDETFPPVGPGFSDNMEETMEEIYGHKEVCEKTATEVMNRLLNFTNNRAEIAYLYADLTFDWIRCWNQTIYGNVNPFSATGTQRAAADNQSAFYSEMWRENRLRLYDQYLEEANCTTLYCRKQALEQSIVDATGSSMCGVNTGAGAWFWFVVMTTVGYGNQSPMTSEGRTMVACLAWISIIVWGIILYVAGSVVGIIMDDFFRKCHLRFMTRDLFSALFWGAMALIWILVVAEFALFWWTYGITNHHGDRRDALWFSYISLLTVGLGDFYLEPQFIFIADVFVWALMFLTGFTLLSTFLGQMKDLCNGLFPDSGEALKERLRNTHLVGIKAVHYKEKNKTVLQNIGALVERMDDDNVHEISKRATRIRQKKELLIHLLHQTQEELDYFTKRGENYEYPPRARVCQEENMLAEIVEKTSRERERLDRYRDGVYIDDDSLGPPQFDGISMLVKSTAIK